MRPSGAPCLISVKGAEHGKADGGDAWSAAQHCSESRLNISLHALSTRDFLILSTAYQVPIFRAL